MIFFYLLSFLEGTSVMAAELLGAKMLSPYFGSSLYVWSAALAVTLGGLAMGYFSGGIVSQKKNTEQNLYFILLASAVFLVVMPGMAKEVMVHTARFSFLPSIAVSCVIFLLPPVFFMGMVSPMIVGQITTLYHSHEKSGKAAGTVYAISTLGGILSTFLLGFYLIPNFGLTKPAIVMGIILGIIPFVKLISARKFFSLIFPLAAVVSFSSSSHISPPTSHLSILYSREGLLGQIIVVDYPLYEGEKKRDGFQRVLFVNRSTQTIVTYKNGEKTFFEYVDLISDKTKNTEYRIQNTEKKKALVLGLGGGSVANELVKNGFTVDAVELDERMADVAKKYFDLNDKVNVNIDDARHYVKSHHTNLKSQYSIIVLDAFIGEVNPHHLFTTEFFSEIKSILSAHGMFFINGNGFWNGAAGKGMRSVCKTLINSGFDVEVLPTGEEEDYRNLLFIAKPINKSIGQVTWDKSYRTNLTAQISNAVILTDEKPQLEILNAEANKRWREACMKYFLSGYYSKRDMLLFK
ncbi:MAG: fused MFS/spermidine synthase [Bacteroidota bacterium]